MTFLDAKPINVLLVDDEKEARNNLQQLLHRQHEQDIRIIGQAQNTREAEQIISEQMPHAVFLDIEMPGENALRFLERLAPFSFEVIFVTAYDVHAIKAFRLNAIDYLLKPIHPLELSMAVGKLLERLQYKYLTTDNDWRYKELNGQISGRNSPQKITLRDTQSLEIVDFRDILFLEAKGSYCRVVFRANGAEKSMTMSYNLAEYEELLPSHMFLRIHRSYLVNVLHIRQLTKGESAQLVLHNGTLLPVGRRRLNNVIDFLKSSRLTDA